MNTTRARARCLPSNVLRIRVSTDETVERGVYASLIEAPIAAAIRRAGLQDRILYLVLTKGVPIRIAGTTGSTARCRASMPNDVALPPNDRPGGAVPGKIDNPYFLGSRELREALPFSHREHDIYLVTRIDAFTVDQAIALVDKAQTTTARTGRIVLDQRDDDAPRPAINGWRRRRAVSRSRVRSPRRSETTAKPASRCSTLGFYSWGAPIPNIAAAPRGLTFVPGSIAANLAGSDARTFLRRRKTGCPPVRVIPRHFSPGRLMRSLAI